MSQDDYYSKHYEEILNSGSVGFASDIIHKLLEPNSSEGFDTVLEVGAGHGQHLKFVKHAYLQYFETDFRKENLPTRLPGSNVVSMESDATKLTNFKNETINRVIATCLIVHLTQPDAALLEWRRVCKRGGLISIYVACEPGLLLRFLRKFTTVRKAKKRGLDHLRFHYREHITFFSRIDMLIGEVFENDKINKKYWPFGIPFWNLNLGVVYQIEVLKNPC